MLTYNTQLKKLTLPEYGRNIQKMVDHCLTIEDRAARNDCAYAIIETMSQLFPAQGDPEEYRRKLWDHLAILSGFNLDIDWPYEVIRPDSLISAPDPIPLYHEQVEYRHYGKELVAMVRLAADMPQGEERDELVMLLANQMKKQLVLLNLDSVDDGRVFRDLFEISNGAINIDPATRLADYKALPAPSSKKKKKKQ